MNEQQAVQTILSAFPGSEQTNEAKRKQKNMSYEDMFADVGDNDGGGNKEYFNFENEGDKLVGKIVSTRLRKSQKYPENPPVPELDVETDSGVVVTYTAWPMIPQQELKDAQRGDIVFIRYNGERTPESGGRAYKHFTISLKSGANA